MKFENYESVQEIVEEFTRILGKKLEKLPFVKAEFLGLNPYAGKMYVDEENGIIICKKHHLSALNYYGGFQYVKEKNKNTYGTFTFFYAGDSRVNIALKTYSRNKKKE